MNDLLQAVPPDDDRLFADVSLMVCGARERVTRTVNTQLTMLHWQVGNRIRSEILNYERAEYGERVIANLAERLTNEYGRGWSKESLLRMVRFACAYPTPEIVSSLMTQLTWTHFVQLISIENEHERRFYTKMALRNRWSVRQLRDQMRTSLYLRMHSGDPSEEEILTRLDELPVGHPPCVESTFKDPYVLDFLNLPREYTESQLEQAVLDEIERFLMELGGGFCFVARQQRMRVGKSDYALDLLFFHRALRRLVAVELKLGPLRPEYKGQMELYLRWLNREMRAPEEEAPVGLLLCTESDPALVELLDLNSDDIHVSTYLTEHLPMAALRSRVEAVADCHTLDE